MTGQYVTRINFADRNGSDTVTATGVSFTPSEGAQQYTATASDQVILSAGVIGSPHLLQLSGIGERSLLESVGIDTRVDLPGVGAHLSDVSSRCLFGSKMLNFLSPAASLRTDRLHSQC